MRNTEIEDPDDEDAYEYCSGATVIYEENEMDVDKYIWAATEEEETAIQSYCKQREIACEDVLELECYIETDE